jgi:hypothetical protein
MPFGEALSRAVWTVLMTCPIGEGPMHEFHRDFCGHGLIRTPDGVKLRDITDGSYITGPPIAECPTENAFIAFWHR